MLHSIDTGTDELLCAIRDGVATVTLNRPHARNSLSDHLTPALRRMIAMCAENDSVGALLITGAGAAFCAGGDVKGMGGQGPSLSEEERVAQLVTRQRTLTGALVGLRKPTIAALPGPAAGAGLAIALACDMRIAARSAFISTGYTKIGLAGDYGIAWLLTRAVGSSRARELMFLSDRLDSEGCERLGLVNKIVPDEALSEEAFQMARRLAAGPRAALALMKSNLDEALSLDFLSALDIEAQRLVRSSMTDDHKEAVRAFIEKRQPKFAGH